MLLLYEPKSDAAALSWGAYTAGLPLANVANDKLRKVARSTSTALTATRLRVTLPKAESFRAIVLAGLNITQSYGYRIRSFTTSSFVTKVYDSGWVYPHGGWADLEWEDPDYWLGIVPWDDKDRGINLIHILPALTSGQYWAIEIDDQFNPAGFVDIGRLFMATAWQPSINYDYGSNGLGFANNTLTAQSLAGSKANWRRINPRIFHFAIPMLPEAEGYAEAYRLMQIAGFDGEVFVIPDPDDAGTLQKRSFLGTITTMDELTQAMFGMVGTGMQLEERI